MVFPEQQENKESGTGLDLIQGLGQTQLPSNESNIHAMTIVGQIEGHMILPPQNKTTSMNTSFPNWWPLNKIPRFMDCS